MHGDAGPAYSEWWADPWDLAFWSAGFSGAAMGRSALSLIAGRPTESGMARMCSWISGASRSKLMICVTRARVIPSRRAIAAWVSTSPASSWRCHSMAIWRSSTTRGVLGFFGGFGLPRGSNRALTTLSAVTRRVRALTLPFLNAPLGPSVTSTVCSQ